MLGAWVYLIWPLILGAVALIGWFRNRGVGRRDDQAPTTHCRRPPGVHRGRRSLRLPEAPSRPRDGPRGIQALVSGRPEVSRGGPVAQAVELSALDGGDGVSRTPWPTPTKVLRRNEARRYGAADDCALAAVLVQVGTEGREYGFSGSGSPPAGALLGHSPPTLWGARYEAGAGKQGASEGSLPGGRRKRRARRHQGRDGRSGSQLRTASVIYST
jgi:hypothetical protein